MQGIRALLALVIAMGVLIVAGTTTLVVVVVHRLMHPMAGAGHTPSSQIASPTAAVLAEEPSGTKITTLARQSDTVLAIALTGGGPDRVLVWDLVGGRALAEIRLGR